MEVLRATSYAKKAPNATSTDEEEWPEYVATILKALRGADKSGWHHRMTMRSAHLIYDDDPDNMAFALQVRHELTQQMFTKTMVLQVWRPENERSGRHFVYTSRYVRFFVRILVQLRDRENLELLAKRLRRKPHEFFEHTKLWQETCLAYLKMLRKAAQAPESYEDAIFKSLNHEEFSLRSSKLEIWCHNPNNKSITRDVLHEVFELKKMNNGLMKPTLIDDLIGDAYAKLYEETGAEMDKIELPRPGPPPAPKPTPAPAPHKPMALTSVMNMDGASDQPPSATMFTPTYIPPEHVPKARAKGVGRRELQRKAEAAVSRLTTTSNMSTGMPIRSTAQATPTLNQTVSVVIPVSRSSSSIAECANTETFVQGLGLRVGDAEADAKDSAPASIHEDADDESELSELDDDDVEDPNASEPPSRPTLFPNLMAKATSADGARSEASGMTMAESDEQPRA
jgi:hypothetical protein